LRARARAEIRAEMVERARLTMDALELVAELVDLALNAEDERIRFGCLVAALDRAGVKPIDFDPKAADGERPQKFDPSLYTFEELEQLYAAMTLMARKQGLLREEEAAETIEG
jgi:hypothetical protein